MNRLTHFFCKTIFFLAILIQGQLLDGFGLPINVFSAPLAQFPIVGIAADGSAVVWATTIDVFPDVYEKGVQLIAGVPQNFQVYTAIGIDQSNHSLFVNCNGDAIAVWTEIDTNTDNFFLRAVPLLNNIWGNATTISDPSQFSVQSFFPAGINLDSSTAGLATWAGQKNSDFSFAIQQNNFDGSSWLGSQDVYTSANFLVGSVMSGSPSGKALAIWFKNIPSTLQAGYYNGSSWNITNISSDVFLDCSPHAAVAMNKLNDALFVWNNSSGALVSVSFVSGVYGAPKLVYAPLANEKVTDSQVAYDQFGNGFALWIAYNFVTENYTLIANTYIDGSWGDPVSLDFASGGRVISFPSIKVDGNGSATAVWQNSDQLGNSIVAFNQYTKSKGDNSWNLHPAVLSGPNVAATQPNLAVNEDGDAIVVWTIGQLGNQTIQAVFSQTIPPQPPASFTGEQIKIGPFNNCDIVNVLQWTASPSPSVVKYFLFRDGKQIATIPANGRFVYENHNRDCREIYVYSITAVDGEGVQSTPLFVTLPSVPVP